MHKMRFFLIRHKPSGGYLPAPSGRNGKGTTFMKPQVIWPRVEGAGCIVPLMCNTNRQAKNVLAQWCQGKHMANRYGGADDESVEITIKPDGTRNKDDMEIVKVEFNIP